MASTRSKGIQKFKGSQCSQFGQLVSSIEEDINRKKFLYERTNKLKKEEDELTFNINTNNAIKQKNNENKDKNNIRIDRNKKAVKRNDNKITKNEKEIQRKETKFDENEIAIKKMQEQKKAIKLQTENATLQTDHNKLKKKIKKLIEENNGLEIRKKELETKNEELEIINEELLKDAEQLHNANMDLIDATLELENQIKCFKSRINKIREEIANLQKPEKEQWFAGFDNFKQETQAASSFAGDPLLWKKHIQYFFVDDKIFGASKDFIPGLFVYPAFQKLCSENIETVLQYDCKLYSVTKRLFDLDPIFFANETEFQVKVLEILGDIFLVQI